MVRGTNRANALDNLTRLLKAIGEAVEYDKKPCIFISHQRADIEECEKVAEYLIGAGIDVYLDKYDKTLEQLAQEGNPDKLTQRLQKGIDNSTHMICVVSTATIKSYWVPFEVGYGYRHIILGILTLKGIDDADLPDYMKTTKVIRGTKSLNTFVAELLGTKGQVLEEQHVIKSYTAARHPLDDVLDWNR